MNVGLDGSLSPVDDGQIITLTEDINGGVACKATVKVNMAN